MKKTATIVNILFLFAFISCADSIITECETDTGLPLGKFANIQSEIFASNCALSGCHAGVSPQAGLNLSNYNDAYDGLVNVTSLFDGSAKRVVPGLSSESYLIKILKREKQPYMPPSGAIERQYIDSIAVWIDNGALRN